MMTTVYCYLFLLFSGGQVTITSEEWNDLNYRTTGYWVHNEGTWFICTSDYSAGAIHLWVWHKGEKIKRLVSSGPREGITAISAITMIPDTDEIALVSSLTGRIFTINTSSSEPTFKRIHHADDLAGDMIFWNRDTILGGAHSLALKQYMGENLWFLPKVQKLLPDDVYHPSKRSVSTHQLKMARNQNRLIVSYVLYPKYQIFEIEDEVSRKTKAFKFRGYEKPPKKYIKNWTNEADLAYFGSFHHLSELTWFQDKPFAKFKMGFTTPGVWVDLEYPERFTWDNEKHDEKVFAIGGTSVVMATLEETDGGLVTCSLWQRSSLPSR